MCWFLESMGIFETFEEKSESERGELVAKLAGVAEAMMLSGVQLSPERWLALGELGRAAWLSAGRRIENERSLRLGMIVHSRLFREVVEAELDGVDLTAPGAKDKAFKNLSEQNIIDLGL